MNKNRKFQRKKSNDAACLVMGKNCVEEVWKHQRDRLMCVYVAGSRHGEQDPWIEELAAVTTVIFVSYEELSRMVDSDSHQQIVAELYPRPPLDLATFLAESEEKENSLVLMLDSIFDPQNLGALLRAAECFGVDAVIWSKNRGTDITPVASKTSVGATELVNIIKVSNLAQTADRFRDAGYCVVATGVEEGAIPLKEFTYPGKTLVMMGSEGRGLQPLLLKQADVTVFIPMHGHIESLNVSQAATLLLHHYHA